MANWNRRQFPPVLRARAARAHSHARSALGAAHDHQQNHRFTPEYPQHGLRLPRKPWLRPLFRGVPAHPRGITAATLFRPDGRITTH